MYFTTCTLMDMSNILIYVCLHVILHINVAFNKVYTHAYALIASDLLITISVQPNYKHSCFCININEFIFLILVRSSEFGTSILRSINYTIVIHQI